MGKPVAGALALGLLSACAANSQASDTITKTCDDYATAVEVVTPLKAALPAKAVAIVDKANTVTALVCSLSPAAAHYSAAVTAWATKGG
jgi:membrane-bound inhibitor of C-type lysozyme